MTEEQVRTRRLRRREERAALRSYWCGYCDAMPGEPCRTKSGRELESYSHGARHRAREAAGQVDLEPEPDENRCPTCGQIVP